MIQQVHISQWTNFGTVIFKYMIPKKLKSMCPCQRCYLDLEVYIVMWKLGTLSVKFVYTPMSMNYNLYFFELFFLVLILEHVSTKDFVGEIMWLKFLIFFVSTLIQDCVI